MNATEKPGRAGRHNTQSCIIIYYIAANKPDMRYMRSYRKRTRMCLRKQLLFHLDNVEDIVFKREEISSVLSK